MVETISETWGGIAVGQPDLALGRAALALRKEYAVRLPARIGEIEEAWGRMRKAGGQTSAARELHGLAHRLTGSGATYGRQEIGRAAGELARELETLIAREAPPQGELCARIDSLVGALREAVGASP